MPEESVLVKSSRAMSPELAAAISQVRRFIQVACAETGSGSCAHELAQPAHEPLFNQLACELFRLQFTHNKVYRQFCNARGVNPTNVCHWHQIPALPTAAFKDFDVTCLEPARWTTIFISSGTTGQKQSRHFHNAESLALYEASLLPWFARHVLPESTTALDKGVSARTDKSTDRWPMLILTPTRADAPCSSLVYMFDSVRRVFGSPESEFFGRITPDGSWQLDTGALRVALRTAAGSAKPVVLLGTAFAFVQLLDYMRKTGLVCSLPTGSRVVETGGYKGRVRQVARKEFYELITALLGVPQSHIVSEYGMCELGSQAYDIAVGRTGLSGIHTTAQTSAAVDSGLDRVFCFPPWTRACVVSPETGLEVSEGEVGLIRVFDLANVLSVMAIQTEDVAVRRRAGFELLGRAATAELRGCSLLQLPD